MEKATDALDQAHALRFIDSFVRVDTPSKPWGEPPDAETDHEPAFRWLHSSLVTVEVGDAGSTELKGKCAALIRNYRLWRDNLNPQQDDFVRLKNLAGTRLSMIAEKWETQVYRRLDLGSSLGMLGVRDDSMRSKPRQDDYTPAPEWHWSDADITDTVAARNTGGENTNQEWHYISLLVLLGLAVEPLFTQAVVECTEAYNGAVKNPGVKCYQRMQGKLYADFKDDREEAKACAAEASEAELVLPAQIGEVSEVAATTTTTTVAAAAPTSSTSVGPEPRRALGSLSMSRCRIPIEPRVKYCGVAWCGEGTGRKTAERESITTKKVEHGCNGEGGWCEEGVEGNHHYPPPPPSCCMGPFACLSSAASFSTSITFG